MELLIRTPSQPALAGVQESPPNGSARDASPEMQAQRIKAAADVLRSIDPDIL